MLSVVKLMALNIGKTFCLILRTKEENNMDLGAFSISLSVKDINASKAFYEKLGFKEFGGNILQNWLILKNGHHVIGLFQGMFEQNTLTFNPGWVQETNPINNFMDVREIQNKLEATGIKVQCKLDEKTKGPASIMVMDPDGNPILIDQHC